MRYSIFILYQATPAWLSLSRERRNAIFTAELAPIIFDYQVNVRIRLFDSEAFHARVSDVMMISCEDVQQYYFFMEALRDTSFFSVPYIDLKDVIVSVED